MATNLNWQSGIKNIPGFLVITDSNAIIHYVNQIPKHLRGSDLVGSIFFDFIRSEYRELIARKFENLLQTGQTFFHDFYDKKTMKRYNLRLWGIKEEGKITNVIFNSLDITEMKIIEEKTQEGIDNSSLVSKVIELKDEIVKRKETAMKYFDFFDNAPDMYVTVDPKSSEIKDCNLTLAKNLGYKKNEIIGQSIFWVYHDDCIEDANKAFQSFLETGEVRNQQIQLRRKNGSKIHVTLNITAIHDDDGTTLFTRFAWRDITEMKQEIEEKDKLYTQILQKQKLELDTILSEVNDVIVYSNTKGIIEYVNPAVQTHFGYTPSELKGLKVNILMPSQYKEQDENYIENYLSTDEKKIIGIGREVTAQKKDKTVFPIHLSVSEIKMGNERKFLGIIRDISDIKKARMLSEKYTNRLESDLDKSEQLYKNLFENSMDSIFIVDVNGNLLEYNEATMITLGFDKGLNSYQTINFNEMILTKESLDDFSRNLQSNAFVKDYELNLLTFDQRKITCMLTANSRIDDKGENTGFHAILRDVTEARILEQHIREEQKIEVVSRLASGLAHDFNNYLTVMMGYTQYLITLEPEEKIRNGLNEINDSGIKAAHLIKQLLSFSRREISSDKQPVNLKELLQSLKSIISKTLASSIILEYDLNDNLESVFVDPIQIEQIILNLIFNSRDAVKNDGIISIGVRNIEIKKEQLITKAVEITVSDTGSGINDDLKEDIFKPFFTTKSEEKGTGLGLAVVKDLVNQNQGVISFKSKVGIGSVFKLIFPSSNIQVSKDTPEIIPTTLAIKDLIFLIVDDNLNIAKLLKKYFDSKNCRSYIFDNPLKAFEFMKEEQRKIDIAILDVVMPYISGVELANRLRIYSADTKIILMTGYFKEEGLERIISDEGFSLIRKPLNLKKLDQLIAELL